MNVLYIWRQWIDQICLIYSNIKLHEYFLENLNDY